MHFMMVNREKKQSGYTRYVCFIKTECVISRMVRGGGRLKLVNRTRAVILLPGQSLCASDTQRLQVRRVRSLRADDSEGKH